MSDWAPIIVAIIAAVGSIAGVVITTNAAAKQMDMKLEQTQAVFEAHVTEKIDALTKQVEKHNTLIERTYALEKAVGLQEAEQKRHSERLKILEQKGGNHA